MKRKKRRPDPYGPPPLEWWEYALLGGLILIVIGILTGAWQEF